MADNPASVDREALARVHHEVSWPGMPWSRRREYEERRSYEYADAIVASGVLRDADDGRPEFRVTFGQQYGREGEPLHPRLHLAHRDGWITIVADHYQHARAVTVAMLGHLWADLYEVAGGDMDDEDWASFFPRGELLRVIAPTSRDTAGEIAGGAGT